MQYLYAEEVLFVTGISVVKLSILMFYRHIFTTQTFARINLVLIAIAIIWAIITLFLVIFQCNPVHGEWNYAMQLSGQTSCINSPRMIFGFEISNVIIDVSILMPPVFMVQKLQLSTVKRISLTVIFLLGLL